MSIIKCNSIEHLFWNTASAAAFNLAGNVQVWRLQISEHLHLIDKISLTFDAEEQARAMSYERDADRERFILCHGILRNLLGKYLEQDAKDIVFASGENKKPFVKGSGTQAVHFNIAHSGDWVLIAVAGNSVGIDLEYIDEQFDYAGVVSACFSYEDINFLQNSGHPRSDFYLYWTRKEALIKATGRGIDNDLPAIPCLDGVFNVESSILGTAEGWDVSSFEVSDHYTGSVACDRSTEQVLFWEAGNLLSFE